MPSGEMATSRFTFATYIGGDGDTENRFTAWNEGAGAGLANQTATPVTTAAASAPAAIHERDTPDRAPPAAAGTSNAPLSARRMSPRSCTRSLGFFSKQRFRYCTTTGDKPGLPTGSS